MTPDQLARVERLRDNFELQRQWALKSTDPLHQKEAPQFEVARDSLADLLREREALRAALTASQEEKNNG